MKDDSPPVDVELLLAHGRFARALARGLLADEHLAEDLAQDAWIAAREHPPTRGVRAWLRAVVRNMAANLRRGAARREIRERAAARCEGLPSPEELAARAETLRRVAEAVLALEEPYRTTVLLRFYDDLPPAEIARLQEIPPRPCARASSGPSNDSGPGSTGPRAEIAEPGVSSFFPSPSLPGRSFRPGGA